MKKKLNIKVEEVKINEKFQARGMYGGACGGVTGIGANGSNAVNSGDPTSNGFGGTSVGGGFGGISPGLQEPIDGHLLRDINPRWSQPKTSPRDPALEEPHWTNDHWRAGS